MIISLYIEPHLIKFGDIVDEVFWHRRYQIIVVYIYFIIGVSIN